MRLLPSDTRFLAFAISNGGTEESTVAQCIRLLHVGRTSSLDGEADIQCDFTSYGR